MQNQKKKKRKPQIIFLAIGVGVLCLALSSVLLWIRLNQIERNLEQAESLLYAQQVVRENEVQTTNTTVVVGEIEKKTTVQEEIDYPKLWGIYDVKAPVERELPEIYETLKKLAKENEALDKIYERAHLYPEKMLAALVNNLEMTGFVEGYLEADTSVETIPALTAKEKSEDFPLFLQWDPRWGYEFYGDDSNIGLAGCGPTCLSMVLYHYTKDEYLTPDKLAAYSIENGYYVAGVGTAWNLLEDVPKQYGLEIHQGKFSEKAMKKLIDQGGMAICSMAKGDFTIGGHFIVIYGYDEDGFLVNDPNCIDRSKKSWEWRRLESQIKNIWTYNQLEKGKTIVQYVGEDGYADR